VLDIKWIRDNPTVLDAGLKKRGLEPRAQQLINLDEHHRELLTALQELQSERNTVAKAIGEARRNNQDTPDLANRAAEIKRLIPDLEAKLAAVHTELTELLETTPNLPRPEVPEGLQEADNVVVKSWGTIPEFSFAPKRHFELGEALGLMDFETAAKLSGTRFVLLRGALAKLERALGNFMIECHTQQYGYEEIAPPLLVKDPALHGAGLLPKFADNAFQTTEHHWLIPTSEVPLSNIVREQILDAATLPLRFVAHTPCFRSEAGAAGRDTRGMIRLHQFNKVELVSITHPDQTLAEHERMVTCAESILEQLELPYRRMLLCGGDMGVQSEKTYDLEVWLPGEATYREISSCSTCGDYQARRMQARFRSPDTADGKKGKTEFVHTLNGSGLAVGRTLVAVLENYQQADGSIIIPQVLRPYMNGMEKITPAS
jgi:seryl-tRNA synthetase (EC 6.1.1.11)